MPSFFHLTISLAGKRQHQALVHISLVIHSLLDALETALANAGYTFHPTLLSGLADGGDMIGATSLLGWQKEREARLATLIGVFPFEREDYLQTIDDKAQFEALLATCESKIFLDGYYLPDQQNADNIASKASRAAAYRQQAQYLVSAGDLLLAIADETEPSKAGGTLETVEKALKNGVPVLFLSLRNIKLYLLKKSEHFTLLCTGDKHILQSDGAGISDCLMDIFKPQVV